MPSYSTVYRLNHPEFREIQNIKNLERESKRYENDAEYRERKKASALARYYRLKEAKCNTIITAS
jgi:hypothetical protein